MCSVFVKIVLARMWYNEFMSGNPTTTTRTLERVPFLAFSRRLDEFFERARKGRLPVLVERQGDLFRIERLTDTPQLATAQRIRAAIAATAGSWKGAFDREAFLSDIRDEREQDSHGRPA